MSLGGQHRNVLPEYIPGHPARVQLYTGQCFRGRTKCFSVSNRNRVVHVHYDCRLYSARLKPLFCCCLSGCQTSFVKHSLTHSLTHSLSGYGRVPVRQHLHHLHPQRRYHKAGNAAQDCSRYHVRTEGGVYTSFPTVNSPQAGRTGILLECSSGVVF